MDSSSTNSEEVIAFSEHAVPMTSPSECNNGDPRASFSEPRSHLFPKIWRHSTASNNLRLYGFRRFKTSHLVNLHFLEEEISVLDRQIYQVGLRSSSHESNGGRDALGLQYSQRDPVVPNVEDFVTDKMVLNLRILLKEYGS